MFFAERVSEAERGFDEVSFRSFRKDGGLSTTVTMQGSESRLSLVPPVPSRLTYRVSVPEGAKLDFDIGVSALGEEAAAAPVTFAVEVTAGSGTERVFEETIRRRFANRWFKHRVDLASYGGRDVTLSFETSERATAFTRSDRELNGQSMVPAWGHPVLGGASDDARLPPLILISIDCLRADHVSAYGYEWPTTPNIDALAEKAVLFENVATVSTWTLPTHMSLLTGLMPTEHGLTRTRKRSPSVPYLPEILAREGYETLGVISGLYLSPTFGYEQGFHVYRSLIDEPAEVLVSAARELFLSEPRRPRFLFLHFFDAHWPYLPKDGYLERVGGRPAEISTPLRKVIDAAPPKGPEEVTALKRLYDAEIAYIDDQLGAFFEELKRAGVYDEALIVVTADHGEAFYEHQLWQHSEVIYNEVTRVPLVVKLPGAAAPRRVPELVSQLNVFPTFLEELGIESPYASPGLLRLAEGEAEFPARALTEITWEPTAERGAFMRIAVSEPREKYVATLSGTMGDEAFVSKLTSEELYDLAHDPGETENLMLESTGGAASMRGDVRAFLDVVRARRANGAGEEIVVDEETREKLRALGYLHP